MITPNDLRREFCPTWCYRMGPVDDNDRVRIYDSLTWAQMAEKINGILEEVNNEKGT
jgi:hypothetical protein